MVRIVVDVMLKPEILDPQGQAIERALPSLGFEGVSGLRQGKHFEFEVDAEADAARATATELAQTLLANPVIEDFALRLGE